MSIHDEALANSVRAALNMDKRISGLPIDIKVSGDEIFIKGKVDNIEQLDVIQFIASGIPGVRRVNVDDVGVKEAGI